MNEEKLVAVRLDIPESVHLKIKIKAKAKFESEENRIYSLRDVYVKLIERGLFEII